MKAKTITDKSVEAIRSALEQEMANGYKPSLGVVFVPSGFDSSGIAKMLDEFDITVFGANTPDLFTDRGITNDEGTVLLMDLDPEYFRLEIKPIPTGDYESAVNVAQNIARLGSERFERPAFIVSVSQMDVPGEAIAEGFLSGAGEDVTLMGGISGGKPFWANHIVFNNHEQYQHGIICLIIDQDHVEVNGLAVSGWKPAGTLKTVTESEGNWVYTIDDEPALDVLLRFTGADVDLDDNDDLLRQIGNPHPLQVTPKEGNPVMKPPIQVKPETGAILCGGQIPEGSKIRFSLPPDFDIVETVIESAQSVKDQKLPKADALLIFSCIGRQMTLGPLVDDEINGLNDVWKVPMAGYFSLGEFGSVEGGTATFHGTTCSWVTLTEKQPTK
ncbi:hypothetical protein G3570_00430 [Balneolaceae bacterium YR4-1]|uniref:Histidine kinase n=1 Tax=Halalkalibaculum roseum TaxID=2709311 RepID=A0A6M1SQK0_9BACT|nr:FIST C-terminal domain-containing protein [Halalkalibaculum roseum]NGP75080.1 hypothetical protein [Halalkalibaculum roseum]